MSLKSGLPYGWWKSPNFWAAVLVGLPGFALFGFVIGVWFGVWLR